MFTLLIQSPSCVYGTLFSKNVLILSPRDCICILRGRSSGLQPRCCHALLLILISKRSNYRPGQMLGGLSAVKSDWCAAVSALPFEVCLMHLAQSGVQMLACVQILAKVKILESRSGNALPPHSHATRLALGAIKPGISQLLQ